MLEIVMSASSKVVSEKETTMLQILQSLVLVDFCKSNRVFRFSLQCLKQNTRKFSSKGRQACGCLSEKFQPKKSPIRNLYINLM